MRCPRRHHAEKEQLSAASIGVVSRRVMSGTHFPIRRARLCIRGEVVIGQTVLADSRSYRVLRTVLHTH